MHCIRQFTVIEPYISNPLLSAMEAVWLFGIHISFTRCGNLLNLVLARTLSLAPVSRRNCTSHPPSTFPGKYRQYPCAKLYISATSLGSLGWVVSRFLFLIRDDWGCPSWVESVTGQDVSCFPAMVLVLLAGVGGWLIIGEVHHTDNTLLVGFFVVCSWLVA